jgi:hypothetical protein
MSVLLTFAGMPLLTSVGQLFVDRPHDRFRASPRELVRRPREGLDFFELGTDTWLAMSSVLFVIVGGLALGNMIDVYRERADAAFDVDWAVMEVLSGRWGREAGMAGADVVWGIIVVSWFWSWIVVFV